ncbi:MULTISPECIES: ABC transporter permease [unclassified Methanoculleus]|uniref:ABC transporter permease n=1 Tax=unclassified Methanoculleus TaxID=2619537 RepID=UPI0025DDFC40|nr:MULTISPECIES: ABC transporter permease [unclassified Methanoculleus]MCK9317364.1 ABC transporter permease [Methanoculleus sp.]MDD2253066.1 ABC transporter permease [Methanoculleus sp.]MDD2788073.1 ABC transporter permease [Methanoculleus sp.]MDD3216027.1 ABC transporter permease [Methanoculleus sp.]MDD4313271.1 ABC transporter permease [Methanoculleus sp.]
MSYLAYVAGFGVAVTVFLWLRDLRIFSRTGLSGYRKAAYWGVPCTALALIGFFVTAFAGGWEYLGLGLVLLGLYLQGRVDRENVWLHHESAAERFFGRAERTNDKGSRKRL